MLCDVFELSQLIIEKAIRQSSANTTDRISHNVPLLLYHRLLRDVLIRRLNRLPLPYISLLDNVAQAWEGEMRSVYQSFFGREVEYGVPIGLLQMDGMGRRVCDVQQLFIVRRNGHHHMAWCMPKSRDSVDTGHDLCFLVNQIELTFNRREIVAHGHEQKLLEFSSAFI